MREIKYKPIQEELLKRIKSGIYRPGEKLPTEKQLADEFNVNRHTLRKALDFLVDSNYIRRGPRVGSIVIDGSEDIETRKTVNLNFRFIIANTPVPSKSEKNKILTYQEILNDFSRQHPWIKAKLDPVRHTSNVITSHIPELFTGQTPTVVLLFYYADDSRLGKLLPLDDIPNISDVVASVEGRLVRRTKNPENKLRLHALPVQTASWMMIVNMTLFRKLGFKEKDIPKTWKSFKEISMQIASKTNETGISALDNELFHGPQSMTKYLPYIFIAGNGKNIIEDDSRININTSASRDFLDWIKEIYQYAKKTDLKGGSLFFNSKAVFRLAGTLESLNSNINGDELLAAPFPLCSPHKRSCTVMHGGFAGIVANTIKNKEEKEAAWLLIRFLLSKETQTKICRKLVTLPSRTDLYSEVLSIGKDAAEFYDYALKYGMRTFDFPRNDDIHNAIQSAFERAASGACNIDQALNEAQLLLDNYILPENRKLKNPEITEYL